MPADRWSDCPQCGYEFKQHIKNLAADTHAAYGSVCEDEWQEICDKTVKALASGIHLNTLRENFEIYSKVPGELVFSYSCSCSRCGLDYDYENTQTFWSTKSEVKGKL